jgi:hypothetical protein
MGNCLVTKLKGVVDNDNLPIFDTFCVEVNANTELKVGSTTEKSTYKILSGDGYFTDSTYSQNLGTESTKYAWAYPFVKVNSGKVIVGISSKATLTNINEARNIYYKVEDYYDLIRYTPVKYSYSLNAYIRFETEKMAEGTAAKSSMVTFVGDIGGPVSALSDFTALATIISYTFGYLSGDASLLPASCVLLQQGSPDGYTVMSWNGTKTGSPLTVKKVNFGESLDNYLVNTADFASSASTLPTNKAIDVQGTRTSASDSAVSTLKNLGYTVKINGTLL